MQNCLCCGKPLLPQELSENYYWHKKCINKFFGLKTMPQVDLSAELMEEFAQKSLTQGITATGVQKKISLHLYSESKVNSHLTIVGFPSGYILKLFSTEYSKLPESEQLVMQMAEVCGLQVVPHGLIYLDDNNLAYITKRIDRSGEQKIPMEDFCQLSERLTEDKYKGSYEQCVKIIKRYSTQKMLDVSNFFYALLFCFITGNSDMHLKNFSLIKTNHWQLSDFYDLLPVNVVNPKDTEETALTLNEKKRNITKKDFITFASSSEIPEKACTKMIESIISKKGILLQMIQNSFLVPEQKITFTTLLNARIESLS